MEKVIRSLKVIENQAECMKQNEKFKDKLQFSTQKNCLKSPLKTIKKKLVKIKSKQKIQLTQDMVKKQFNQLTNIQCKFLLPSFEYFHSLIIYQQKIRMRIFWSFFKEYIDQTFPPKIQKINIQNGLNKIVLILKKSTFRNLKNFFRDILANNSYLENQSFLKHEQIVRPHKQITQSLSLLQPKLKNKRIKTSVKDQTKLNDLDVQWSLLSAKNQQAERYRIFKIKSQFFQCLQENLQNQKKIKIQEEDKEDKRLSNNLQCFKSKLHQFQQHIQVEKVSKKQIKSVQKELQKYEQLRAQNLNKQNLRLQRIQQNKIKQQEEIQKEKERKELEEIERVKKQMNQEREKREKQKQMINYRQVLLQKAIDFRKKTMIKNVFYIIQNNFNLVNLKLYQGRQYYQMKYQKNFFNQILNQLQEKKKENENILVDFKNKRKLVNQRNFINTLKSLVQIKYIEQQNRVYQFHNIIRRKLLLKWQQNIKIIKIENFERNKINEKKIESFQFKKYSKWIVQVLRKRVEIRNRQLEEENTKQFLRGKIDGWLKEMKLKKIKQLKLSIKLRYLFQVYKILFSMIKIILKLNQK